MDKNNVQNYLADSNYRHVRNHRNKLKEDLVKYKGGKCEICGYNKCIEALENNYKYRIKCLCEPQLGKRGLYTEISRKGIYDSILVQRDVISYSSSVSPATFGTTTAPYRAKHQSRIRDVSASSALDT